MGFCEKDIYTGLETIVGWVIKMEIKEPRKIEHLDRMETMLTELMVLDEVDGETFEKYLVPLVEKVGKLRTLMEEKEKIGGEYDE